MVSNPLQLLVATTLDKDWYLSLLVDFAISDSLPVSDET